MSIEVVPLTFESAMVSWNGPALTNPGEYYQLLFWEVSSTTYRSLRVEGGTNFSPLNDLRGFTRYRVQIRVACGGGGFGALSDVTSFTTSSSSESLTHGLYD